VSWHETPDQVFVLASTTLGRAQLLAIADGLQIDGRKVGLGPLPAGVDGRLTRIGREVGAPLGAVPPVPMSAAGHAAAYQSGDQVAYLVTYAADAGDLAVARYLGDADRPVDVRGHGGWVGETPAGDAVVRTVVWQEAPGVIGILRSTEDEATLLAIADGLRTPSDAEWRALVDRTHDGATEGTIPAHGATDGYPDGDYPGGSWQLYANAGELCMSSTTGDRGSSVCGDPRVDVLTLHDNGGDAVMVFGVLPAGATGAEVPGAVGSVEVHGLPDGRQVYVAPIDPDHVPAHVTLVGADGRAVDTLAVDG